VNVEEVLTQQIVIDRKPNIDTIPAPKILAIIPAFNEEKSITAVALSAIQAFPNVDVIVINDKSTDDTAKVLRKHKIRHISLPVNLGIGGAVQTGFRYAVANDYDLALQVDGDGQHPADQIALLIRPVIEDRADFVIGSRYLCANQIISSKARRIGSALLSAAIFTAMGKKVSDPTSGFRAFNRRTIRFLSEMYPQEYPEPISVMELLQAGFKMLEVQVTMKERLFGKSSIAGWDSFFYMLKVIFTIAIVKLRRRTPAC
jgi:glycosyltransferase involved in cell wall biosynthesis